MPRLDLSPKKLLGQHWLRDISALIAMCEAAGVGPNDTVLEIGPGRGTLTAQLVKRAKRVVAVEFDSFLAQTLKKTIMSQNLFCKDHPCCKDGPCNNASRLEVVEADILRFDLRQLPPGYKVVANIPYYLTSNLLRVLCESSNPFARAALLVQREVAERAAAEPGDMSMLAVMVQFYCEVSLGRVVPAKLFTPPPKVDSQILILSRRAKPLFPDVEPRQFFHLVQAGFSQRRKTLLNSLSGGLNLDRAQTTELLERAKISPAARAQTLSLEDWHQLYNATKFSSLLFGQQKVAKN